MLSREDLIPKVSNIANNVQINKLAAMHAKGLLSSSELKTMTDILLDTRKEQILMLLNGTTEEDTSMKVSSIKLLDIIK